MLCGWTKRKQKGLPFGVPMVWREPRDHVTNCYFCMINTKGVGKKNRHKISYSSIPSAIRPVSHLKNLQSRFLVIFPQVQTVTMISESMRAAITRWFLNQNPFQITSAPEPFSQTELNDLVCDLGLSKKAEEIVASRLQAKHLLGDSAKVSYFQKRDKSFAPFFSEQK